MGCGATPEVCHLDSVLNCTLHQVFVFIHLHLTRLWTCDGAWTIRFPLVFRRLLDNGFVGSRRRPGICVIGRGDVSPSCRPLDVCSMVIQPLAVLHALLVSPFCGSPLLSALWWKNNSYT